jgi:hypothetical protein
MNNNLAGNERVMDKSNKRKPLVSGLILGGALALGGCLESPVAPEQEPKKLSLIPDTTFAVTENRTSKTHQANNYETNYALWDEPYDFYINSNYVHNGSYMTAHNYEPILTKPDFDFNAQFKNVYFNAWKNDPYTDNFPFSDENVKTILQNNNFIFTDYFHPYYSAIYTDKKNVVLFDQRDETSRRLTKYDILHESGHMFGLGESLANRFLHELGRPCGYQDENVTADPIFDEALCDRVGKQRFWQSAFTSNAEYKRLYAENMPEIRNIDDFVLARSIDPWTLPDEGSVHPMYPITPRSAQIQHCGALKLYFKMLTNEQEFEANRDPSCDREYYLNAFNDHITSQAKFARENNIAPIELVFDDIIKKNTGLANQTSIKQPTREIPNSYSNNDVRGK